MKFTELQNKSAGELREMVKAAQVRLGQLMFQLANKNLKDFSQLKKARHDVARLLTAINALPAAGRQ